MSSKVKNVIRIWNSNYKVGLSVEEINAFESTLCRSKPLRRIRNCKHSLANELYDFMLNSDIKDLHQNDFNLVFETMAAIGNINYQQSMLNIFKYWARHKK